MPPVESPAALPPAKPSALRGELSALKIDRGKRKSASPLIGVMWAVLALALLGAGLGAAYWALKDRLFPLPVVQVDSARIMTLGQAQKTATCTGYLESRWQAAVGAKVPGRIANIPVEEGDRVKAGDVLAELEHLDLDAMLASKKVAVTLAEAQLSEAESQAAQAKLDVERERDVFGGRAGTKSAMEKAESAYTAAQAVVSARAAAVDAAQSAVEEAQEAIRNMFIYAPFDGTVVTKDAEKGESIMPGGMGASSGRGSVITLAQLDHLEVDTDVKEDILGRLHKGQMCEVTVDAVPDHAYQGKLREIIPMGDRTRGIVKVKVAILDPDERLFPELSATVHFLKDEADSTAAQKKGVFVPAKAIQTAEGEQFAWVLENGRVRKAKVNPAGEANDSGLVPVTGDLRGGENLVIDPPSGLTPGDEVKAAE